MKTLPLLCAIACSTQAQEFATFKLSQTIPLPGVAGRIDHLAADVPGKRVFIAALGNDTLEIVDVAAGQRLKSITGLRKPAGVLALPDANSIGVANGGNDCFKLFDGTSYELRRTVPALEDADNVRHDPKTRLIYVGYGEGALAVLAADGTKRLDSIKLAEHPESFQLETNGPRIFVNVPGAQHIAVIDRERRIVTTNWPMKPFRANFPMALDEPHHRLFVGCRQPARLVVLETGNGRLMGDVAISNDTDDLFYDGERRRVYVSCGEGAIDVIDQRDADTYIKRETIPTRVGARTSLFSAGLDALFLAVPQRDGQPAELRVYTPKE